MPGHLVTGKAEDSLPSSSSKDEFEWGTVDTIFSVDNAEEEIKLFTSSPSAKVKVIETHYMSECYAS